MKNLEDLKNKFNDQVDKVNILKVAYQCYKEKELKNIDLVEDTLLKALDILDDLDAKIKKLESQQEEKWAKQYSV